MTVVVFGDGQAFWHEVATPLTTHAVLNNVSIGLANRTRKDLRKDLVRIGVFDASTLTLGALRTMPHRLNLAHTGNGVSGVGALVRHLVVSEIAVPGIVGEQPVAEAFAARWVQATGQRIDGGPRHGAQQNLYEITDVVAPPVAGAIRLARASERETILRWELAFAVDAGLPPAERDAGFITRFVDEGLSDGTFFVWEVAGVPVATARLRPIAGLGARISGVYTPDERRGSGYASALTAALSRRVLAAGQWCCLFADADNPLTNRIYQRIGFVKVATFADIMFCDA